MHAGQLGRFNHHLVGHGGVEPGDIVTDGAGQHFDMLRQIADGAAQRLWVPLVGRCAVQPDFTAIGAPGSDQQPRQR